MNRHINPQECNRKSKAPYNFVPLPDEVFLASTSEQNTPPWNRFDEYVPGMHTGWVDLTIKTETPLYVRCAPKVDDIAEEQAGADQATLTRTYLHRQDFFHHGDPDQPVIPGSSIRGLIRTLVEILGFGKMQWFTNKRLIYRAVGDTSSLGQQYRDKMLGKNGERLPQMLFEYPVPRLRGGYLEKNGPDWAIRPAREFCGESFVHVDYSDCPWAGRHDHGPYGVGDVLPVFVRPVGRTKPGRSDQNLTLNLAYADSVVANGVAQPAGYEKGVLVRSGHMGGRRAKHMHCVIYDKDSDASLISISPSMWKLYVDDRELTRGIDTDTRKLKEPGDPLFYLVDDKGDLVFFGPTMMFRIPYTSSIKHFVPAALRNQNDPDLAEMIFGTVDAAPAIKGRVYFEDAKWKRAEESPFLAGGEQRLIPKILSAPKPTSFQHYLVQPMVKSRERRDLRGADNPSTLHNWDQPEPGKYDFLGVDGEAVAKGSGSTIRGHKRYWHKPCTTQQEIRDANARYHPDGQGVSSQHTIIRPVKRNTVFKGRVRFENLSDLELGAVLSALQLPQSKRHHLGMGKPLGMGSVKIDAVLHVIARTGQNGRYTSLFFANGQVSLGELSEQENQKIGCDAKKKFRDAMVQHYNSTVTTNRLSTGAHLWDIPRLQVLALMLEWDEAPSLETTEYEPMGRGQVWRARRVLPTPHSVVRKDEPAWGNVPVTGQGGDNSPSLPALQAAGQVSARIGRLGGRGDVSQMPDVVERIAELTDEEARRNCAQQLRGWLELGGRRSLWRDKKHADTEWRRKLDSLLL